MSVFSNEALPKPAGSESPALRLERGEILYYPVCPFPVVVGGDHLFLLQQRLGGLVHKNISYNPQDGKAAGYHRASAEQAERLRLLLAEFSKTATAWLSNLLPEYATGWRLDRVSYRPEEESTRKLRPKARNDLLHVDSFPSRPTNGARILRLFVNVNPTEPRVWATSDSFGRLLERFGRQAGLPGVPRGGVLRHLNESVLRLFRPGKPQRSAYDAFMLRFHDYLKASDELQERGPKRLWHFAPGSAWVVFTDTVSHAALRGRYALEHSYFVTPETLLLPEESPPALLARACGMPVLPAAA